MDTGQAGELLAAVGGGIALVVGLTQVIKSTVLPERWTHGRAPMVLAAALSIIVAVLGGLQIGLDWSHPSTLLTIATAFLAIYTGAVGAHQTLTKAGRIAAGTTNTAGPDDADPGEHGHG